MECEKMRAGGFLALRLLCDDSLQPCTGTFGCLSQKQFQVESLPWLIAMHRLLTPRVRKEQADRVKPCASVAAHSLQNRGKIDLATIGLSGTR